MILMDGFSGVHFADVKSIAVGILATDSYIDGFDGIESKARTFVIQVYFLDRGFTPKIVQDNRSINTSRTDDILLRRVILHPKNTINIPL